jgi:hypothetical protein
MRLVRLGALVTLLASGAALRAQPELPPAPAVPPAAGPVAPAGAATAPAQPAAPPVIVVEPPPPTEPPKVTTTPPPAADDASLPGVLRGSDEYLLWWIKSAPLPALATRNRVAAPVLGVPGTRTLIGGEPADLGEFSGGRFVSAMPLNDTRTAGMEFGYWFLGTRTTTLLAAGTTTPAAALIGRPYLDAATAQEEAILVAAPGVQAGEFRAASSARAQGFEANLVGELWGGGKAQLAGLVGYRFLQVHEGLFLWQQGLAFPAVPFDPPASAGLPTYFAHTDQFDAHNRFHGGQVGLRGDWARGPLFLELTGKVAFGQTTQVVKVGGVTHVAAPGEGPQWLPGGAFALPTNSGRLTREAFAVVPEGIARFGVRWGGHARFFVGYNFLYLSEAVRPGDQIDRTLNLTQAARLGGGTLTGPERPALTIKSTDLWLQGLLIGFETRY